MPDGFAWDIWRYIKDMQDSSVGHMAMRKYHRARICRTALSGTSMIYVEVYRICRTALSGTWF